MIRRAVSGGVREGIGHPRNPLPYSRQLFAVLPSTLCRTFPNSLPCSHPSAAKGLPVHGKEPSARRQRVVRSRPKEHLALVKVPHRPAQSPRQTATTSPSASLQEPVGSSLKPYGQLIPSRRAIEAEPSGFRGKPVGLLKRSRRVIARRRSRHHYIDMRQRYGRWRGIRQAGPRWDGADQTIDARCSMDRNALLNGWTRVRQWIARRDSMDRTA